MSNRALKEMIDRMVEESIRRILPTVMNEVLIKTLANSGALAEERAPAPRRKPMKRRKPVREQRQAAPPPRRKPSARKRLEDMLEEARTAGAEFYEDPRAMAESRDEYEPEEEFEDEADEAPAPRLESRLASLPPALRGMAEDLDLSSDDPDEMWGADEHDSSPLMSESVATPVDPNPIRDVNRAAQAVGIDFNRLKSVVAATSPTKRPVRTVESAEDARAKAQFEMARIKRERERLNGGKPVE